MVCIAQQQASQPSQSQQYISQGLNKLRESLVNFRIEDSSNCGDLYVYMNKDQQIYILKLEEIYESSTSTNLTTTSGTAGTAMASGQYQQTTLSSMTLSTSQQNQSSSLLTTASSTMIMTTSDASVDSSIVASESNLGENKVGSTQQQQQQQIKLTSGGSLSRRPSHASINDASMAGFNNDVNLTTQKYKTQNLSGGVVQATQSLTNAVNASNNPSMLLQRNNPEYQKLHFTHLKSSFFILFI